MSGGSKGSTQQTTQTARAPQYVQDAQKNLVNTGQSVLGNFTSQTPNYGVAGFTPDQENAFDLARGMTANAFTANAPQVGPVTGYQASGMNAANAGPAAMGATTNINAAQTGGNDYQQFLNPYTSSVVDTTNKELRRQNDVTTAGIRARAAAAGAFGGSRGALQEAEASRNLGTQIAQTTAQLMSQGFDKATAVAMANTQNKQQAEVANAGAANTMSQFNAGQANNMGQFNAGLAQQANQFNAGAANTAGQFNATAANDFALKSPVINDALAGTQFDRQRTALQQLLGIGNQQQATAQQGIQMPLTALQMLSGVTPKDNSMTQTTVAPNTAPSPLQQLLGAAGSVAGLAVGGPAGATAGSLGGNLINKWMS